MAGLFLILATRLDAGEFTVTLGPGEGTILQIGTAEEFGQVRRDYFSGGRKAASLPAGEPYRLDFLPLGFYLADVYAYMPKLKDRGVTDAWEWYDKLLALLKSGGVNTIYIQGGGGISTPDKFNKFAAFCAERGFKLIVQPGDVYFFGPGYFTPPFQNAPHFKFKDSANYYKTCLEPVLQRYLPKYRDNKNIFAWAPVEELSPEGEPLYVEYKKLLRELAPNQLLVQVDSQQADLKRLRSKLPPIPDLFGFDRYCWWHQVAGTTDGKVNYCLWTPHFASRWLYNVTKEYADTIRKLYHRNAFAVQQGPAWLAFRGEQEAAKYGWKADENYICPTAPDVRYHESLKLWSAFSFYLPPGNAERLSSWLAICAGFKGVFLWAAVNDGPDAVQKKLASGRVEAGDKVVLGIVHYDLTTTPQWEELAKTWNSLKPLEQVILAMEPTEEVVASSKDPHVFVNSFTDKAGRRFVVVVNGQIGQWDGGSPEWIEYPRSKLSVGLDGNLTGYKPFTTPRTLRLILSDNAQVFDLKTMKELLP